MLAIIETMCYNANNEMGYLKTAERRTVMDFLAIFKALANFVINLLLGLNVIDAEGAEKIGLHIQDAEDIYDAATSKDND